MPKSPRKRLKPEQEKFAQLIVSGKNQTQAYMEAYPNASSESARSSAPLLVANPSIQAEIQKRKEYAAQLAGIDAAQVTGAIVNIAFASITDAFDDDGKFSFQKAKETGAVHLIKKLNHKPTQFGDQITVEFYDKQSALVELGQYLGLRTKEKENIDGHYLAGLSLYKASVDFYREKFGLSFDELMELFLPHVPPEYKERLEKDLREYCELKDKNGD